MSFEICCCHAGKKLQTKDRFSYFQRLLSFCGLILIGIYRSLFTAHFGAGVCRFEPTCSAYANEAFLKHPFFTALNLTIKRLIKCRPGSSFGYDPVPCLKHSKNSAEKIHEF